MSLFSALLSRFLSKEFLMKLLFLVVETFVKSDKCNMTEAQKNDLLALIEKIEL